MIRYLFLLFICLWGCSGTESAPSNTTAFADNIMTIDYRITVGKSLSESEIKLVQNIISSTFHEVDTVFNKWNPNSELSQLNSGMADEKIKISPELVRLLDLTNRIVTLTEGRFDPTIEPLQQLWKSRLENKQIPSPNEIASIQEALGWDKIHVDNGFFHKDHDKTQLDLGGIAKGYCVDLLVERINAAGYPDVFVEWGGEIRASGQHPDQRPWKIFISRLGNNSPDDAIDILTLNNQAIATSGDYLQNWQVGAESYFHILDPVTLQPLKIRPDSVASASVLAPSCAVADGLATALMMFENAEKAQKWAEKLKEIDPELSFWIISRRS